MKKITAAVICVLLLFLAACANDADAPGNIDKCITALYLPAGIGVCSSTWYRC